MAMNPIAKLLSGCKTEKEIKLLAGVAVGGQILQAEPFISVITREEWPETYKTFEELATILEDTPGVVCKRVIYQGKFTCCLLGHALYPKIEEEMNKILKQATTDLNIPPVAAPTLS
jgi:hypothetical protein